jgi:hypothetical protein
MCEFRQLSQDNIGSRAKDGRDRDSRGSKTKIKSDFKILESSPHPALTGTPLPPHPALSYKERGMEVSFTGEGKRVRASPIFHRRSLTTATPENLMLKL